MELTWDRAKAFPLRGIMFSGLPCLPKSKTKKVSSCAMCNAFRNQQQRETLHPHDIPGLPWQVVGTDLF